MADIPASNWSETDGSNTTASPDGMPEGMAPSGVNNWGRAVMGAVRRWYSWTIPKVTAGTSTAYTLSYTVAPGALVDQMTHLVRFDQVSGAAPTLNVNSLGAKPIHYYTAGAWGAVPTGYLTANLVAWVYYDSGTGAYRIITTVGAALLAVANTFLGTLTMLGASINEAQGSDIASATTTDIGAATGNFVQVTGTTTITGLGTVQAGTERTVRFTGALTLTHNGTSLILPGAANITTVANDLAVFRSLGGGNWICITYQRSVALAAGGQFVSSITGAVNTGTTAMFQDDTIPQVTEGDQYMSAIITPKSATSILVIDVVCCLSSGAADNPIVALFRDGAADACAAVIGRIDAMSASEPIHLRVALVSGSTSASTFTVRAGSVAGSGLTFNGVGGVRRLGTAMVSSITIEEKIF